MEEIQDYYSPEAINKLDATYNLIYGQRSNGKTYAICRMIVEAYLNEGIPSAYIRRLDEMIKPKNIQELFTPHLEFIVNQTEGAWNSIVYRSNAFFFGAAQL